MGGPRDPGPKDPPPPPTLIGLMETDKKPQFGSFGVITKNALKILSALSPMPILDLAFRFFLS